jgi:hypothetical protein
VIPQSSRNNHLMYFVPLKNYSTSTIQKFLTNHLIRRLEYTSKEQAAYPYIDILGESPLARYIKGLQYEFTAMICVFRSLRIRLLTTE